MRTITSAFGDQATAGAPTLAQPAEAITAVDEAEKQAAAAVSDAKAEAEAAMSTQAPRREQTPAD